MITYGYDKSQHLVLRTPQTQSVICMCAYTRTQMSGIQLKEFIVIIVVWQMHEFEFQDQGQRLGDSL